MQEIITKANSAINKFEALQALAGKDMLLIEAELELSDIYALLVRGRVYMIEVLDVENDELINKIIKCENDTYLESLEALLV